MLRRTRTNWQLHTSPLSSFECSGGTICETHSCHDHFTLRIKCWGHNGVSGRGEPLPGISGIIWASAGMQSVTLFSDDRRLKPSRCLRLEERRAEALRGDRGARGGKTRGKKKSASLILLPVNYG